MFRLSSEPIKGPSRTIAESAGASVVFEGRVRNVSEGCQVARLEYEAFDELAQRVGEQIMEEAGERFPILRAWCAHRTGTLEVGEVAIRVEVEAGHRKEAFEACAWIVDEAKRRLPIWKHEHFVDGESVWVNCEKAHSEVDSIA